MFGKNELSPVVRDGGESLAVQEIFHTIQGEGPYAGNPAVFIRLAGCNLKCHFCDTEFGNVTNMMSIFEIVSKVREVAPLVRQRRLVVLTGGEPLRQNVLPLIKMLGAACNLVQIETAGSVWLPGLDQFIKKNAVHIVCSPKTPTVNPFVAMNCQDWKYIVRDGEHDAADGLPSVSTQSFGVPQRLFRPPNFKNTVWLAPCDEHDVEKTAVNVQLAVALCMEFGYRLSLQTHKIVGLP